MTSTLGRLAALERARVRARDAVFTWARENGQLGVTLDVLLLRCPPPLFEAYDAAVMALEDERAKA